MIRGLILDFDGLILDTEGPAYQSWVEIYQELGADLPLSAWETWVGGSPHGFDPCGYLEGQLGRAVDREGLTERQLKREAELIEVQGVLPGVEQYIADAKRLGLKLGLASSSDCEWVYRYLEKLGLRDKFDSIKCADDVENVKPEPDLYLAVLEGLGLRPQEAIALEDSPNGITSAQAAGLFCVVVPNPLTRQLPTGHADLRLDSLAGLSLESLLALAERKRGNRHDRPRLP
ncbi:MAG TPA: HAD family hydrolase [Anaerolineae bacterium]|nr:HAD family hydrolase [Anaerolineae bacterium]